MGEEQIIYEPGSAESEGEDGATRTHTVTGNDWDTVYAPDEGHQERVIVNMGPQHPSTHGVLRLILELEGESVTEARAGVGFLHTGIEKNIEFRNWVQGTTFVTRMDYLSPLFNETAYCLAVEKLLGITDDIPERATIIRVIMMEFTRISSHLVALATGGMEVGALTAMIFGFREREIVLDINEMFSGLRMNPAYVRPGGLADDLPEDGPTKIREAVALLRKRFKDLADLLLDNPIWMGRLKDVGKLDLTGCMQLGLTGPPLRSTGLPHDIRKSEPYCGYETYDFEVATSDGCDSYARFLVRLDEMYESCKIIEQAVDRLEPGPVMVADPKIAWPSKLAIGPDGQGNSLAHIREIMGESMEALIHHFKLVTEGFRVPPGQFYQAIESPRGELGVHVVSNGGTRPYRVHFRDPAFTNLQAIPIMCEGGMVSDVVVAVASLDPVLGGVDR